MRFSRLGPLSWFLFACFFTGVPLAISAQDIPKAETLLKDIKDDGAKWKVGFCALGSDSSLSAATQSLAHSLPSLWRAAFTGELTHTLNEQDQAEAAAVLLEKARNQARSDISQQIETRDKAWLDRTLTTAMDADFDKKIATARLKLAGLLLLKPEMITIAPRRTLTLTDADKDRPLYDAISPADISGPDRLAQEKQLSTVVYGNISEEKDYIFLRLYVWDALKRKIVWQESRALLASEASSRVDDQIEGMAEPLLGYASAGLKVSATPEGTMIIVRSIKDPQALYRDVNTANFHFLEAGEYNLFLKADGYEALEQNLTLTAGKTAVWKATLQKSAVKFLSLVSEPSGASVYLYSRYQGKTPLEIPQPDGKTTIFLELAGYQRQQYVVGPDSDGIQNIILMKDILNWPKEFRLRRDRFYNSLGWFALSCLPPIIFNGLYQNLAASILANGGSNDQINLANLYYRLSVGTLVLTGVAAVDTGIQLSSYLEAADYQSGHN